eukprot:TRINITY_DN8274_c0_g1_i1.p1 TRINITY_DN8274_c0_g1~~TRINITY_DN8274_c0_g1_i1.p1  ORF type:complete len:259 (+),score=71.95 TRINITY_DN8274_c0_g1_i1:42-818(+)
MVINTTKMNKMKIIERLDSNFAELRDTISSNFDLLDKLQKVRVKQWITVLSQPMISIEWKKNRNAHAKLLLNQIFEYQELRYPFCHSPPAGALDMLPVSIKVSIPSQKEVISKANPKLPSYKNKRGMNSTENYTAQNLKSEIAYNSMKTNFSTENCIKMIQTFDGNSSTNLNCTEEISCMNKPDQTDIVEEKKEKAKKMNVNKSFEEFLPLFDELYQLFKDQHKKNEELEQKNRKLVSKISALEHIVSEFESSGKIAH